jgi:hypothetical protein
MVESYYEKAYEDYLQQVEGWPQVNEVSMRELKAELERVKLDMKKLSEELQRLKLEKLKE